MKKDMKYHWNENIKSALLVMILGGLFVIGARIVNVMWPAQPAKVYICFEGNDGIEQCEVFKKAP